MRSSAVYSILAASAAVSALPQNVAVVQTASSNGAAASLASTGFNFAETAATTTSTQVTATPTAFQAFVSGAAPSVFANFQSGNNAALASQSALASEASASGIPFTATTAQVSSTASAAAGTSATPTGNTEVCGATPYNPAFFQCFPNSGFQLCPIVQNRPMVPCGAGCHNQLTQVCNNGQIVDWGVLPLANGFGGSLEGNQPLTS